MKHASANPIKYIKPLLSAYVEVPSILDQVFPVGSSECLEFLEWPPWQQHNFVQAVINLSCKSFHEGLPPKPDTKERHSSCNPRAAAVATHVSIAPHAVDVVSPLPCSSGRRGDINSDNHYKLRLPLQVR